MVRGLARTTIEQELCLYEQDTELSLFEWANERINMTGQFGDDDWVWLGKETWFDGYEVWKDGSLIGHVYLSEVI